MKRWMWLGMGAVLAGALWLGATSAPRIRAQGGAGTDSSTCVACHTEQVVLQAMAKEPEKGESLSEGEG